MRVSTTTLIGPVTRTLAAPGWTCTNCRSQVVRKARTSAAPAPKANAPHGFTREYASRPSARSRQTPKSPRRRRGAILAAAATAGAGTGMLAFTDDIKQGYEATERAGRVGAALAICINDYRTTLNQRDQIDDVEQQDKILRGCHKRCADRTLKVMERNGGVFIKLGQHLSAMTYLLPQEWTDTFIPLQDRCPVSSYESIEKMFRGDTGQDISDYFSEFSHEPIGAASLAQVHLATIKETGQKVAVKVQHPTLALWAPLDMALTKFTFSTLKRFFPEYDLEWLSSEMEVSLPLELDFQCEAENAMRTKRYFAQIPELPLVVPEVIWAQKRILVMANESGNRLDDLAWLDAHHIDRDQVSATLARIFNEMIFGKNAPLHCDPHGGNIAIRERTTSSGRTNFEVILYDHGLYRTISEPMQRSYAKMWLAVIDGDMKAMAKHANEFAGITEEQFPLFASAITGRDFSVVSSSILAPRSDEERKEMGDALQEGLLSSLVQMLGQVPRVVLLILKTNDLTRALDENLHTRQGPLLGFLILARYCARTVLREQIDNILGDGSSIFSTAGGVLRVPINFIRILGAYVGYLRVEAKLGAFELYLGFKRMFGMRMDYFGTAEGGGWATPPAPAS